MTMEAIFSGLERDLESLSERMDALEAQMNGVTKLLAEIHLDLHAHLSGEDNEDALTTRWSGSPPE